MTDPQPFEMTLSLNVLEHLGINLYSNIPSVLSEVVANAWDAEAEKVNITFDKNNDTITIQDDGTGMTRADINNRFLRVGYKRRKEQKGKTLRLNRAPMGRKGIGKLSLFSIAGIVEVYTIKDGEKSGFRMNRKVIRDAIENESTGTYKPEELSNDEINLTCGTKIVLKDLKRRQTIGTSKALRTRISRRFSIIGDKYQFEVYVNEIKITPEDRDYYQKLQFLWTYGDQSEIEELCPNCVDSERRPETQINGGVMTGWLGTVTESRQVRDDGENLNRIAIFVRGKMAQEDILGDFSEYGVYATYLIGELRVDCFDRDEEVDAATTNRQQLVEDDQRYIDLKKIIQNELKHIQKKWNFLRSEQGTTKALEIPELSNWIDQLPKETQKNAKSWLGRIYRLKTNSPEERKQLLKHSVFAFEFYSSTQSLAALEKIDDQNLDAFLPIFHELDSLEECLYGQIVQQRVGVIKALENKVDMAEKEKAIQEFLFDHLWLLDPQWERVESTENMEKQVNKVFKEIDARLSDEEKRGRLDIKYRKTAGTHIIIELKKPDRIIKLGETVEQVKKYFNGMTKLIERQAQNERGSVEIILLVGKEPQDWGDDGKQFKDTIKPFNTRLVFFDHLLESAERSYQDYFNKKKGVDRLQKLIQAIEELPDQ